MKYHNYKLGEFVCVRFGVGTQLARVEGFAKTGRIKVRGYNAGRREWYLNLRTIECTDILSYWLKPLPDLSKGWRVHERTEDGLWVRGEDSRPIFHWEPLPEIAGK